jgi:hypothetical protein
LSKSDQQRNPKAKTSKNRDQFYHPNNAQTDISIPEGYKKISVCIAVDDLKDVQDFRLWSTKWGAEIKVGENRGCGCCVNIYDILVPTIALAELPPTLVLRN